MRWNKINVELLSWEECVFLNVPFRVKVFENETGAEMSLHFVLKDMYTLLTESQYSSVENAKADIHNFILNHLALYSTQVHRECLEANVMTWRRLKEQLNQIPEDQLDEVVKVLDSDNDWMGEPEIVKAKKDMFCDEISSQDATKGYPVIDKNHYYLSIDL